MLGPIIISCVIAVIALLGNSLVIFVFFCRWRSTGAFKVYILILAVLDLLSSFLSLLREVWNYVSQKNTVYLMGLADTHSKGLCIASTFLVYHINCTTAILLVVIATSRFVKVMSEDNGVLGPGRPKSSSLKARLMRVARITSTVRGAKIASVLAVCAAALLSGPVLIVMSLNFSCSVETPQLNATVTETSSQASEQPANSTSVFKSCMRSVHSGDKSQLRALHLSHFIVFLLMATIMSVLYGTILRHLWEEKQVTKLEQTVTNRRSSVFYSRQSGSLGALCDVQVASDKRSVNRTMSEGDANSAKNQRSDPAHPRSVSNPFPSTEVGLVQRMKEQLSRKRLENDSAQMPENETNRLTFFPPVAYSAQLRSLINLSVEKNRNEEDDSNFQRQASVSSFQFSKHGDRVKQTTLVFLIVSAIFLVSYLPYFIIVLKWAFCKGDQCQQTSDADEDEMLVRLYLLSNILNPVVYGFCNPDFRTTVWKFIVCRREVI